MLGVTSSQEWPLEILDHPRLEPLYETLLAPPNSSCRCSLGVHLPFALHISTTPSCHTVSHPLMNARD